MVSFNDALQIFLTCARTPRHESVPLFQAGGRVLAADVHAWRDVPVRNLSAMDGFACRSIDRDHPLTVIETIAAGSAPQRMVGPGQCSRIMTGAIVPQGADCVVMFEDTSVSGTAVTVNTIRKQMHVRMQGEDQRRGDRVLQAGTVITPAVLAVLASEGCDPVTVTARPGVGIIATGDELVEPSEVPVEHQIRNTNGALLYSQTAAAGCVPRYFGICRDSPQETEQVFQKALSQCEIVIFSGGVSAGDFDFVHTVIAKAGMNILVNGIAVKPGKPTLLATSDTRWVIGLPGNPVASLVIFETLIRPFLYRMAGSEVRSQRVIMRLGKTITRRSTDRMEFVPVSVDAAGTAIALAYHGSAHLYAYARAQGIIAFAPGVGQLDEGSGVEVILL